MANPPPPPATTAVLILRNSGNGDYEIYDIGNNSLLAASWARSASTGSPPAA
jgi:hypothetical protein